MPYPTFDRSRLRLLPLSERTHDLSLDHMLPLTAPLPDDNDPQLAWLADRMVAAKARGATIMLMIGAHVIRSGVNRFLIDLMEKGYISLIGTNGACAIHDLELAMIGATTESVARYIQEGQFGLWQETGSINEAAKMARRQDCGFGEAVGHMIQDDPLTFPHAQTSLFAAGYRLGIPLTIHVGLGQDIVHEHPNCDGAATGAASYRDFLTLAHYVENLENGVMLNIGSAVMGPEVYLKALSMARNVAHQNGKAIRHFTTAVFDLVDLGDDLQTEAPKATARYYFRPFKTVLVRTVADGGESVYIRGEHRTTIPLLHHHLLGRAEKGT